MFRKSLSAFIFFTTQIVLEPFLFSLFLLSLAFSSSDDLLDVLSGHSELLHDNVTGSAESELVNTDNLSVQAGVLVPEPAHSGLHGGAIGAALGQHGLPVGGVLAVEAFHAGHANDSDTGIILEGGHEVLDLAPRAHDDLLELPDLRLGHVGSLQGPLAPDVDVDSAHLLEVLPGEDEGGGARLPVNAGDVRPDSLLGIGRPDDVQVGDDPQAANGLDGLVGGSVLAYSDAVVRPDVRHLELGQRGDPNGGPHVVGENQKGGAGDGEDSVVGESVHDGSHGVFPDSEVEVLSAVWCVVCGGGRGEKGELIFV